MRAVVVERYGAATVKELADTVTIRRSEIWTALNKPEAFVDAIVLVRDSFASESRCVRPPFTREPDLAATSVTYRLGKILARGEAPR